MKNIKSLLLILSLLAITCFGIVSVSYNNYVHAQVQTEDVIIDENKSYEILWKKVTELSNEGLYASALQQIDVIAKKAKNEHNNPQLIKAHIHKIKFNSFIKEDDYVLAIQELDSIAQVAPAPLKQFTHTIIADLYWGYYQSHRYQFYNRTELFGEKPKDMRKWDLRTLVESVRDHHLQSLEDVELLKSTNIEAFDLIIKQLYDENKKRWPTLYDFIANKALDFFESNTFDVTRPAETFVLDDVRYYANGKIFSELSISTMDSLSTEYFTTKIYQDLTAFHAKRKDVSAQIEVDLRRLQFIHNNSVMQNNDSLYYIALKLLTVKGGDNKITAEVFAEIAQWHYSKGGAYSTANDSTMQLEYVKAHQIATQTIEKFENCFGTEMCKNIIQQIETKSLSFTTRKTVASNTSSLMSISYRNVTKMYGKIIPISYEKWQKLQESKRDDYYKKISEEEAIYEWDISLEDSKDFQSHRSEIELPKLDYGHYIIFVSNQKNYSAETGYVAFDQNLWATDFTATHRKKSNQQEVLVLDNTTGKSIVDAKVEVFKNVYNYTTRKYDYKKVESGTTNDKGIYSHTIDKDYSRYFYSFTKGDDYYFHDNSLYSYNYDRTIDVETQVHLFTDRAIYRPGQTIYFKGIVAKGSKNDFELRTQFSTKVTFKDVNYNVVDTKELKTNDYGSFSGSFQIPMGILNGSMRLETPYGTKYIRVEEYKRPKFSVNMKPLEGDYRVFDEIKAVGEAKAFAGNYIDGAKVSYTVTRTAQYGRYWYWMPYYGASKVVKNGTTTTDDAGKFEVVFEAMPDKSMNPEYLPTFMYTIQADVTDINGETHSTIGYVNVGYHNLNLSVYAPSEISTDTDTIKGSISAVNLNGRPLSVQGKIKLYKLDIPKDFKRPRLWSDPEVQNFDRKTFEQKFPMDTYKNEDLDYRKWNRKEIKSWDFDSEENTKWYPKYNSSWEPGKYIIEIEAKDNFGKLVKNETVVTIYSKSEGKSPTDQMLWVKADKAQYEPGDQAKIFIASAAQLDEVKISVERQGNIIDEQVISLNKNQKVFTYPITEADKGGVQIHILTQKYGVLTSQTSNLYIPFKEKRLDVKFATFRDKLKPGQNDEWTVTIKGHKGEKMAAEFLASMYDASLDEFASNGYYLNFFSNYYATINWGSSFTNTSVTSRKYEVRWNNNTYYNTSISYPKLNWFGHSTYYYNRSFGYGGGNGSGVTRSSRDGLNAVEESVSASEMDEDDRKDAPVPPASFGAKKSMEKETVSAEINPGGDNLRSEQQNQLNTVKARTNFNETAFFYPQLKTNADGEVVFSFTAPESLTEWKFIGLAHTKDLATGSIIEKTVTQKELMVIPNAPRFFRENDQMVFSTKISNISEKKLNGNVRLQLLDPFTDKEISADFDLKDQTQKFEIEAGKSGAYSWSIQIPEKYSTVKYRIVAASDDFSDGEEKPIPVLSNRMLVTESMPLPIKGGQTKTLKFDKLINSGGSKTLKHHALTLEFTANPAWYAVQALPYMMEYPYECAEQTFSRFYANSIASHIVSSKPEIQKVFEAWKTESPEAFLSNLEKNQELKSLLIQETPWVLDAKDESERKKRVALLFDMNKMDYELSRAIKKLNDMQSPNGGFPWFKGMRDNRYITQHIVAGLGHMKKLKVDSYFKSHENMLRKAIAYLDDRIVEDYNYLKSHAVNMNDQHISYTQVHYLYTRSFFPEYEIKKKHKEAIDYYKGQAEKYWKKFNLYAEGMIGLAASRNDNQVLAKKVMNSLKERSLADDEMGVYWKEYKNGYYWYQAPIETQALMIEFFDEVDTDEAYVDDLRVWLLKQKQTQDWKTTKATADACYALLLQGTEWLDGQNVDITIGDTKIVYDREAGANERAVTTQPGSKYFKTVWSSDQVKPNMGNVTLKKADKGVAWGGLYWQYFEQLDKITHHETPLKINKTLNKVVKTNVGEKLELVKENTLQVGDKVRVRIEIEVDRRMEFVHLKDMRAATFEPTNVISSYRYQDGLGYYQTTKDASTNFFFDVLPKGVYVFEYDVFTTIEGDFSNGISSMQCMYAPEFTTHSEGIRVKVK